MDTLGSDGTITDHVWGRNWPEMVENFPSEAHQPQISILGQILLRKHQHSLVVDMHKF